MKKRATDYIKKAEALKADFEKEAAKGSFAYALSSNSMDSHISELRQIELQSNLEFRNEILDFRFIAPSVSKGSMPLRLVSDISDYIRKMIGYSALRLSEGGIKKRRITDEIESSLDLRLAGIYPGSSRLMISSKADRDLFDDGVSKNALNRIFRVLDTGGDGTEFLEAITELGPPSARKLREFLELIRCSDMETEFTWKYSGDVVRNWKGSKKAIEDLSGALAVTEITEKDQITLSGTIELLSKREKIDLRTSSVRTIRILFPRSMLTEVEKLHINQYVTLACHVTETENPITGESSIFYELKQIGGEQDSGGNG
jgi:hypothetical protein